MMIFKLFLVKILRFIVRLTAFLLAPKYNLFCFQLVVALVILLNIKQFFTTRHEHNLERQRHFSNQTIKNSFETFIKIHEMNIDGEISGPRRIVFQGHTNSGYANRVYSMISALTIGNDKFFFCIQIDC
jgi:hypothetical protein